MKSKNVSGYQHRSECRLYVAREASIVNLLPEVIDRLCIFHDFQLHVKPNRQKQKKRKNQLRLLIHAKSNSKRQPGIPAGDSGTIVRQMLSWRTKKSLHSQNI